MPLKKSRTATDVFIHIFGQRTLSQSKTEGKHLSNTFSVYFLDWSKLDNIIHSCVKKKYYLYFFDNRNKNRNKQVSFNGTREVWLNLN